MANGLRLVVLRRVRRRAGRIPLRLRNSARRAQSTSSTSRGRPSAEAGSEPAKARKAETKSGTSRPMNTGPADCCYRAATVAYIVNRGTLS